MTDGKSRDATGRPGDRCGHPRGRARRPRARQHPGGPGHRLRRPGTGRARARQTRARAGFLAANTRARPGTSTDSPTGCSGTAGPTAPASSAPRRAGSSWITAGSAGASAHTVYPQQDLVSDLRGAVPGHAADRSASAPRPWPCAMPTASGPRWPCARPDGRPGLWRARYVAGCDGRHGAARRSLPAGTVRHHRDHGITWLGLLAEAPPSMDAVGYAVHERGFAGHMARPGESPATTCSASAAPRPTPGPRSGSGTNWNCACGRASTARCTAGPSCSGRSSTWGPTYWNRCVTARCSWRATPLA